MLMCSSIASWLHQLTSKVYQMIWLTNSRCPNSAIKWTGRIEWHSSLVKLPYSSTHTCTSRICRATDATSATRRPRSCASLKLAPMSWSRSSELKACWLSTLKWPAESWLSFQLRKKRRRSYTRTVARSLAHSRSSTTWMLRSGPRWSNTVAQSSWS